MFLSSGTCCWCVWGLLTAADWNGAAAAISDQKDCWHQPTYPTSYLWPFLVLLSVWSTILNVFTFHYPYLHKITSTSKLSLLFALSIWWSSRLRLSGDKSESCCCLSAAPRKNIVSCVICTLLTLMCAASRSSWRSRASSCGLEWSQPHLVQLCSTTHSSILWVLIQCFGNRLFSSYLSVNICKSIFLVNVRCICFLLHALWYYLLL